MKLKLSEKEKLINLSEKASNLLIKILENPNTEKKRVGI